MRIVVAGSFVRTAWRVACVLLLGAVSTESACAADKPASARPIPVILDTDIGDDIDDTWALGLLLKSPELDLKLAVGDFGKPQYRAGLLAKFLEAAGRTDVPVGIGVVVTNKPKYLVNRGLQSGWLKDYKLAAYPGKVYSDGVQAIIDTIMQSKEPVTLIAIGPVPNIAAALERQPQIAQRARFVGMQGSVRFGYDRNKPEAEANVRNGPQACQKVFAAPWHVTITPLDTCDLVDLSGDRYRRVRDAKDPVAVAIIENYRVWSTAMAKGRPTDEAEQHSSTLFDPVAVYLAISQQFCQMERLGIRVNDQGFTLIDEKARQLNVATSWKDLEGFRDFLALRLAGPAK